MSGMWSLLRVELGQNHKPTGNTKHQLVDASGRHDFPPFVALEIVHTPGEAGFYLMYEPVTGHGTDTWHQTLDDAMHQAEFEFNVADADWVKTEREF